MQQADRLLAQGYLSTEERQQVWPEPIVAFAGSQLGKRAQKAKKVLREYEFSVLLDAADLLETSVEIPVPDLVEMWGPGYSIPSEEGNEAIAMMMRLEGIVLDTCYTGKAFAGLVRRAREGFYQPDDNVLFVHTGGAGGLFAQDWEKAE